MAPKKTPKKTTAEKPKKTPKPRAAKKKPDAQGKLKHVDDIERVKIEKDVPVSMNREEAERQAHALASTTIKIKAIQDKIAEFAAKHRKELRDLRKDEQRLATAIDTGKVMKSIKVLEIRDYRLNQIRFVDPSDETRELAPAEVMPPEMRQRTLFEDPPAGDRVDVEDEDEGEDDAE